MKRIVIAGAGYAGIQSAKRLARRTDHEVWLVDQNPYHQLVTEMYRVVGGDVDAERLTFPVTRLIDPDRVHFVKARVDRIAPEAGRIETDGPSISYDVLILALGSEPEYYHVPGARRFACTLQYVDSARRLRSRLRELTARPPADRIRLVAIGGGLTGVELIAEIAEFFRERKETPPVAMSLVQAAPTILPEETKDLVAYAEEVLREWKIDIRSDAPVKEVTKDAVILESGEVLPSHLTIWAGGVRANPIPARSGLPADGRGRVHVGPNLVVSGHPHILAAGDVALATDPATERPLPPTAQLAIQEGRVAGENASAVAEGRSPNTPFRPRPLATVASLGRQVGIADFHRFHLHGRAALAAKKLALWRYLFSMEGLAVGFTESPMPWWAHHPEVPAAGGQTLKPPMSTS